MTAPEIPVAADTDVLIMRAFTAPRHVVWRFFTEAARLAEWFGPTGVTVDPATTHVEPHLGGRWEVTMVTDEGPAPIVGVITAIDPEEYLEVRMTAKPDPGREPYEILLRLWFHDNGDRTRLTLHQGPFEPVFRDLTIDGWELSFGKLDGMLA